MSSGHRYSAPTFVSGQGSPVTIERIQSHLEGLGDRLKAAAKRTRRFSWYSWGFLFAAFIGVTLAGIVDLSIAVSCLCAAGSALKLLLLIPAISCIPAVGLILLAVAEVVWGRREAGALQATGSPPNVPSPPSGEFPGWTERVRQAQQTITHLKNEVEISFIPLFLGMLILSETLTAWALTYAYAGSPNGIPDVAFWVYGLAVPFLLTLIPVYFASRTWIRSYQELLNRQVQALSALEGEFFARFAGLTTPG